MKKQPPRYTIRLCRKSFYLGFVKKSAWKCKIFFKHSFSRLFLSEVKSYFKEKRMKHKAVLLIENVPSHRNSFRVARRTYKIYYFLPPNLTFLIQNLNYFNCSLRKILFCCFVCFSFLYVDRLLNFTLFFSLTYKWTFSFAIHSFS